MRTPALTLVLALAAAAPTLGEHLPAPDVVVERPPLLLTQLASVGVAREGDWLYVYSGHLGPTHHHSLDNLSTTFARLSLVDGHGWELLPCPLPLQSTSLVAHRGGLIRVGGMTARNRAEEKPDLHSVATVARFDPVTRTWSPLPDLPEPRSSHDAVVVGDRLFVIGGWTLAGDRELWLETAWSLDLAAAKPAWTPSAAPAFGEKRALALAVADDKVIALGGMTSEGELSKTVHLYDPAANAWSAGPDLPFVGFGAAALGVERDVYASGIDSPVFRLGLHGGDLEWEEVGALAWPRYFHRFVPAGEGALLAVGGVARPDRAPPTVHQRTIETFVVEPKGPRVSLWTVPAPGRAKNRQGVFLHRDALWVFGGNDSLRQHDFGPDNFLDEGWRLDLGTMRFEAAPAFPARRQTMQTAVVGGVGVAVGGFGHTGKGTRSWPDVQRFDFKAGRWEAAAPLPGPRTQFDLVVRGDELMLFGGLDYDSSRGKEAFRFPTEVLALKDGAFAPTGLSLPQPRRAFGGALLGDRYFLVGGMKEEFGLITDVDVLDLSTRTWSKAPAPATPRISPLLVALGGKLYLAGGSSPVPGTQDAAPNPSLEVYDPSTGAWSTLIERLPLPTTHMRMFAWRDRLLLYSVHVEGARAARVAVIAP
ncbi:MAG: hypothetical protein M9894_38430 [Planctomycetes bacterium]|nr:hypothetical protein [Planctomycetota bacterium]